VNPEPQQTLNLGRNRFATFNLTLMLKYLD
jgi:hypothetical protein